MKIDFEIKSRGSILINYGEKSTLISGELTFQPPVFYADLKSFKNWNSPFENEKIDEEQKNEIVNFITSQKNPTKIIFD
jgi:hypothetical protein